MTFSGGPRIVNIMPDKTTQEHTGIIKKPGFFNEA